MDTEALNKYEIMLILSSELGDSGTEKALNEIRETISEHGGSIFQEDIWGMKELSYRIKKEDDGYYVVFYTTFEDGRKIKDVERLFNLNNELLRSLILRMDKHHVIRTSEEYEDDARKLAEENEKLEAEKAAKQQDNRPAKPARSFTPSKEKEAPKAEKVVVKKEVKSAPKAKEEDSSEKSEKESKAKLDAVDEKLKNLIDDPDISI